MRNPILTHFSIDGRVKSVLDQRRRHQAVKSGRCGQHRNDESQSKHTRESKKRDKVSPRVNDEESGQQTADNNRKAATIREMARSLEHGRHLSTVPPSRRSQGGFTGSQEAAYARSNMKLRDGRLTWSCFVVNWRGDVPLMFQTRARGAGRKNRNTAAGRGKIRVTRLSTSHPCTAAESTCKPASNVDSR